MEAAPLAHRGFVLDVELAHAWTAAAEGELSRARAIALAAAAGALARGQDGFALRALHEACRLGAAADPLPGAAGQAAAADRRRLGGRARRRASRADRRARRRPRVRARRPRPGRPPRRRHAARRRRPPPRRGRSPPPPPRRAFRDAGRESSARRAGARAAAWLGECEGARPPTLPAAGPAEELTPREREAALLAAGGSSSAEIAERLVVSVRTVDNHLQRAYGKLGIAGRHELAAALHRSE